MLFVMYWVKGRSKINKPWNRQGGGHIICSAYAGGGRGRVRKFRHLNKCLSFCGVSQPQPPLYLYISKIILVFLT